MCRTMGRQVNEAVPPQSNNNNKTQSPNIYSSSLPLLSESLKVIRICEGKKLGMGK